MAGTEEFDRCIYCFSPKVYPGPCSSCGYENGLCCDPVWWLSPGTLLKGQYMVGKHLKSTQDTLCYLGWDLQRQCYVQIVECYPEELVTRDITNSEQISCFPGKEAALEAACREFQEKANRCSECADRAGETPLDVFSRNGTCYYVCK